MKSGIDELAPSTLKQCCAAVYESDAARLLLGESFHPGGTRLTERLGQIVKAQVLALDTEKRQLRLSMKQLVPSGLDEYITEHKAGDVVTGRLVELSSGTARVELGEGVFAICKTG